MKKTILVVLVLLISCNLLWSATLFVDVNAGGDNNGTSWTHAYTSLQSALDVAVSPDEIWIAKGTYVPSYDYGLVGGGRSTYNHFRLINGVTIYGGFAGTESAVSERTDYAPGGVNETILSGDLGGDHCYHVFYHNSISLDNTAVLDGVTISDGMAYYGDAEHAYGGGMYNYLCTPTLVNVTFKNNEAKYGGAMYNGRSTLNMTNCSFIGNYATLYGGALFNVSCSPILINGLMNDNTCDGDGGSIYLSSSSMQMTNITITGNSADNGGGIYSNNSDPELYNCIIWGNSSTTNGNEIYIDTGAPVFNFSCYGNDTGDIYNNGGTFTATNNCITTNPQFAGVSNNADHPYSIAGISPCADTGNDSYCSESYDIRGTGYDRKLDKTTAAAGTIDMGAYEYKVGSDAALPVELLSFSAAGIGKTIELRWTTASETDNLGFIIERKSGNSAWQQIASYQTDNRLVGQGTTSSPSQYSYCDTDVTAGEKYEYRLFEVSTNGATTVIGTTSTIATVPATTQLFTAYPNPFNPSTNLKYQLAINSYVTLTVYDILGRQIKLLVDKYQSAGEYTIQWDGTMDSGMSAPSGTYVVRMQMENTSHVQKVLLIK